MEKHHSGNIFIQTGLRNAEKEKKKKFVPNYVPSRPGQENSLKNGKKIKKLHFNIIQFQTGLRLAEKERKKKFRTEFHSYPTRDRKFR